MLISDLPEIPNWCEICSRYKPGCCDGCARPVTAGTSYRSQTFHHHPSGVNGVSGTVAVHKVLCLDCYRQDFQKMYPQLEVPV